MYMELCINKLTYLQCHLKYCTKNGTILIKRRLKVKNKKCIGSNFDDFLTEEGFLQESEVVAIKRVIAYALEKKMMEDNISISHLAKELDTSRSAISRILDPENTSITLITIGKIAKYLGKKIVLSFA